MSVPVGLESAAWCSLGLALNLMFLQMGQGGARFKSGERPPEDQSLAKPGMPNQNFGYNTAETTEEMKAKEHATRWTRMHQNALENVPLGLIIGWGTAVAVMTSGNAKCVDAQRALFIVFTSCRWLHSICYLLQAQPWRALAWLGAWLGTLGMLIATFVSIYN